VPPASTNNSAPAVAAPLKKPGAGIAVSPLLVESSRKESAQVLESLKTSASGLTQAEADARLEQYGPNEVAQEVHHGWLFRMIVTLRNPLVILLSALATISFLTGDVRAGTVMCLMVVLGVMLRFVQESRADTAAAKLKAMIKVTATVIRDGQQGEMPLGNLVPGDMVALAAGDMIPADIRVVTSKDLFIIQGSLTGESLPVEKFDARETRENLTPIELSNLCFLGTSVESGSATGSSSPRGSRRILAAWRARSPATRWRRASTRGSSGSPGS
jgi:Mg2+-importing ATPase